MIIHSSTLLAVEVAMNSSEIWKLDRRKFGLSPSAWPFWCGLARFSSLTWSNFGISGIPPVYLINQIPSNICTLLFIVSLCLQMSVYMKQWGWGIELLSEITKISVRTFPCKVQYLCALVAPYMYNNCFSEFKWTGRFSNGDHFTSLVSSWTWVNVLEIVRTMYMKRTCGQP